MQVSPTFHILTVYSGNIKGVPLPNIVVNSGAAFDASGRLAVSTIKSVEMCVAECHWGDIVLRNARILVALHIY